MTPTFPDNPFWDYSLALYGRPEAAAACLALQQRRGANTNLMLLCCWSAAAGRGVLGAPVIERLVAQVAAWRSEVVEPLHAVRTRLKDTGGVPGALAGALRERVLATEVDAEHVEQLMLAAGLEATTDPAAPARASPAATAALNLAAYFAAAQIALDADDRGDLTALLRAAFPGGGETAETAAVPTGV